MISDAISRIAWKLKRVVEEISDERGDVDFAALLLREDSPGRWDFVLGARWLKDAGREVYEYVTEKLKRGLSPEELLQISRTVLLDRADPALARIAAVKEVGPGQLNTNGNPGEFMGIRFTSAVFLVVHQPHRRFAQAGRSSG
jgi:hypothetical protein